VLDGEAAEGEAAAEASDAAAEASDAAAEAGDEARLELETEVGQEAEPPVAAGASEAPLLQFDRMRSSPIPPGT